VVWLFPDGACAKPGPRLAWHTNAPLMVVAQGTPWPLGHPQPFNSSRYSVPSMAARIGCTEAPNLFSKMPPLLVASLKIIGAGIHEHIELCSRATGRYEGAAALNYLG